METSIYTSWFDQAPSDALQCLLGGLWRHSSVTQRFGLLLDIPNMIKKMALDETPMDWNLKWPCKLRFGLGFEYVDIYTCLVSMYIYICILYMVVSKDGGKGKVMSILVGCLSPNFTTRMGRVRHYKWGLIWWNTILKWGCIANIIWPKPSIGLQNQYCNSDTF